MAALILLVRLDGGRPSAPAAFDHEAHRRGGKWHALMITGVALRGFRGLRSNVAAVQPLWVREAGVDLLIVETAIAGRVESGVRLEIPIDQTFDPVDRTERIE
jgi:hypothetical protein